MRRADCGLVVPGGRAGFRFFQVPAQRRFRQLVRECHGGHRDAGGTGSFTSGGVTAPGDQEIFDLVCQNRSIGNVVRVGLKSEFDLRPARCGFVGMNVEVPTPGRNGIVKPPIGFDIVLGQNVRTEDMGVSLTPM